MVPRPIALANPALRGPKPLVIMSPGPRSVWAATPFECADPPDRVFPSRPVPGLASERFCLHPDYVDKLSMARTMMIYIDGACLNNGAKKKNSRGLWRKESRGAWSFVFNDTPQGVRSHLLERKGANLKVYEHTNNRAELRAAIAALRFHEWWAEGWQRVVLATDSEYVKRGATDWIIAWASREWQNADHRMVANRDLWPVMSKMVSSYQRAGCEVSFWKIHRYRNKVADAAAKAAARQIGEPEDYCGDESKLFAEDKNNEERYFRTIKLE